MAGCLFESYKQNVGSQSSASMFALSVTKWAFNTISVDNLRKVYSAAVESDVDGVHVEDQRAMMTRQMLNINDFPRSPYRVTKTFSEDARDSTVDSMQEHTLELSSHRGSEQNILNTHTACHSHQKSSTPGDGNLLSVTSELNNCYTPPADGCSALDFTQHGPKEEPGHSPNCCLPGPCALQEMTSREFSIFTRRDAQNKCSGDAELSYRYPFPVEYRYSGDFDIVENVEDSENKRCYSEVGWLSEDSYSENPSIRDQRRSARFSSFESNRRYPFINSPSNNVDVGDNKRLDQISGTARGYVREQNLTTRVAQDLMMGGDFKSHPWVSETMPVLSPRPQCTEVMYNIDMAQIVSGATCPRSYKKQSRNAHALPDSFYSHMSVRKETSPETIFSSSSVDLDPALTSRRSPDIFSSAEEAKEGPELPQSNRGGMGSRSYLAQLLQAPIPMLDSCHVARRSPYLDPATSSDEPELSGSVRPGAKIPGPPHNMPGQGKPAPSLDTTTQLQISCERPQNLNLHYSSNLVALSERPISPSPFSNLPLMMINGERIPASKNIERNQNYSRSSSDADGLSATCDLYRDAQGAIDMTFESLTHASSGRTKTPNFSGSTGTQCRTRSEHSLTSSGCSANSASCGTSPSDSDNTATLGMSVICSDTIRSDGPVTLLNHSTSAPNSPSCDDQLTATELCQISESGSQGIYNNRPNSPSTCQSDNFPLEQTPISSDSTYGTKPTSAPVLKQRYLSQAVNPTTAHASGDSQRSPPGRHSETNTLVSSFKRPFCQPEYTQPKWKMQRLVLSGY
ncbi:hypothetical protein ElyMa_005160600 [Elysia marginata]|uniref:Uncharacterized protein n=1 Tax=Elysia marginata TaxID=1093978 RepID=A0AAV4JVJ8_9GAST|nr:hypothetical protein ElyMa_005160600 [Elysia marginata]